MNTITIIVGSTRPGRFGDRFAAWLESEARDYEAGHPGAVSFRLVDLAKQGLPFLDESSPASLGKYEREHTKAWARIVGESDGFLVVAPEYNHGYSAALKNAFDFLFKEWNYKPVAFASYGGMAGGARAVEQLRQVAGELKLYDIREAVMVPNYWSQLDQQGAFVATADQAKAAQAVLAQLVYWADAMREPRRKLSS